MFEENINEETFVYRDMRVSSKYFIKKSLIPSHEMHTVFSWKHARKIDRFMESFLAIKIMIYFIILILSEQNLVIQMMHFCKFQKTFQQTKIVKLCIPKSVSENRVFSRACVYVSWSKKCSGLVHMYSIGIKYD